jgi:hypothetical protein
MNAMRMIALGLAMTTAGCALTTDSTEDGSPSDRVAPQNAGGEGLTLTSSPEGVTGKFENACAA